MRFLLGLLLGIALGVAVGLVLAPQPGSETRKALREQLKKSGEEEEEVDSA
jgi:gas vesicle protein